MIPITTPSLTMTAPVIAMGDSTGTTRRPKASTSARSSDATLMA
jgi:hypothetical protein